MTMSGKTILITGAGGSIGSELARHATNEGAKVILVERSEGALFNISRELPHAVPVLADVRDREGIRRAVRQNWPSIVIHAAAYKHVPLMENNPVEACENNVMGTRNVADAAVEAGVSQFVLISTDKAAAPSSVMGMTKYLAERVLIGMQRGATKMCAVRFGNVMGSAGSVLPIWEEQAARGEPLTVTDPRMTRYFISLQAAVRLVMDALTLDDPGVPIYTLDMGQPRRIMDMARKMAREKGVEVVVTGARPGEKLHETLTTEGERLRPTAVEGVNRIEAA